MLEIILILHFYRKLSELADKKNRSKWLPRLLPVFWIGMEIIFGFLYGVIFGATPDKLSIDAYGFALLGGFFGAGIIYCLVQYLPQKRIFCPECGWEINKHGPIGVECKECRTWLRVAHGTVSKI